SIVVVFFFFFFSSRRRHTRCLSDWSSDVCSSDLPALLDALEALGVSLRWDRSDAATRLGPPVHPEILAEAFTRDSLAGFFYAFRSEERRVGKECRSRVWAEQ